MVITTCMLVGVMVEGEECPHPKFMHDHVCSHCWDAEQALEFSRKRYSPTNLNTVLVIEDADALEFKTEQGPTEDLCVTKDMIEIIWECRTDRGYCNQKSFSQYCEIQHSPRNGHFFYKKMKCHRMSTTEL